MKIKEYSEQAHKFALYEGPTYPLYGLAEEVGEFLGKIAKAERGDKYLDEEAACKELGDVLWMLNECCRYMNTDLETVAKDNIKKLTDRANRGVIKGDGDER